MIFCFQEDSAILKAMLAALRDAGFENRGFERAEDMFEQLDGKRVSLVIADVSCEKEDGSAVLQELRARSEHSGFSILLIAAEWMKINRLSGIEFADETVLFKPFNVTRMMQAVNKALSAGYEDEDKCLEFAELKFEVNARRVTVAGNEVRLTRKEYELLYLLMDNTEQVFSREQLFNCVWKSDYLGQSRTVDVHIGTLRRKLGTAGKYIKTLSGKGYCMREIE